jgi:hypothetical protein
METERENQLERAPKTEGRYTPSELHAASCSLSLPLTPSEFHAAEFHAATCVHKRPFVFDTLHQSCMRPLVFSISSSLFHFLLFTHPVSVCIRA